MPEEFAPEWEYYTPDPEIEYLIACSALTRGDFAALDWSRTDAPGQNARNHGFSFGCGNPNHYRSYLGPEKPIREAVHFPPRKCCRPECTIVFRPERAGHRHCSHVCGRRTVAELLTLPPRTCSKCLQAFRPRRRRQAVCSRKCSGRPVTVQPVACERCDRMFKPLRPSNRYCSVACIPRGQNGPTGATLARFRGGWLAGVPVADLCREFGVDRTTLAAWRRRLGLASRPRGGALAAGARYGRGAVSNL